MAQTTTIVKPASANPAAKSPPAPPTPVNETAEKALKTMREGLSSSKLGHLGRRIEMAVRDAQETIDTYGSKVIVAKLGGQDVRLPVKTTILTHVRIEVNGVVQEYGFVVGAGAEAAVERGEAKLDSFPESSA